MKTSMVKWLTVRCVPVVLLGCFAVGLAGCTPSPSEATPDAPATPTAAQNLPPEYVGKWQMQVKPPTNKNHLHLKEDGSFSMEVQYVSTDNTGSHEETQNKSGQWTVNGKELELIYTGSPAVKYQTLFTGKDKLTLSRPQIGEYIYDRASEDTSEDKPEPPKP